MCGSYLRSLVFQLLFVAYYAFDGCSWSSLREPGSFHTEFLLTPLEAWR